MHLISRWLKSATWLAFFAIFAVAAVPGQMTCQCQAPSCHSAFIAGCGDDDNDALSLDHCRTIGAACHCQTAAADLAFVNPDASHFDHEPLVAVLPGLVFTPASPPIASDQPTAGALRLRSRGMGPPAGRGPPALA